MKRNQTKISLQKYSTNRVVVSLLFFSICLLGVACKNKKPVALLNSDVYYTCSMHPQIVQNTPGDCPICGMKLIRVEKKKSSNEGTIMLSDQQIQLGNIRVDTVGKGTIGDETILTATLNIDETKSTIVSARISGRIERLYFKSEGDFVQKGQRLYDLYSEELNNAKQEYLLALEKERVLDNSIVDLKQLVQSAKNKLLLWGMSESQIHELERTKKVSVLTSFYSPESGYVTSLESREGDYVTEGGTIVRLANLSTLWAEAQVYTSSLSEFDPKATATVRFPDLGTELKGTIQLVNPEINPDTRINLVRVAISNVNSQLKPGMPAYVVLKNRQRNSLTLPVDAVISNEKMNLVWLQVGKNSFKSVMVQTGVESGNSIEIRNGLKEGDVVVTNGAYLLNSEYVFKKGADPMAGHDMSNL